MFKIALVVWIMLGVTIAGMILLAVLSIPSLADQAAKLIPLGSAAGFALAIPLSFAIAKRIAAATQR
jgi:hypothetical protein